MRITRVDPAYLSARYGGDPPDSGEPHDVQYRRFVEDCYGWADFWARALRGVGYEYAESFANVRSLQESWARENGAGFAAGGWEDEILRRQIASFRPEVLFVEDHLLFTGDFVRQVRAECPSIRLVLVWCGSPIRSFDVFHAADLALSNVPELRRQITEGGGKCEYLAHAFDPVVLERLPAGGGKRFDLSFIGLIVAQAGFHNRRAELVRRLLVDANLTLFSGVWLPSEWQRARHFVKRTALRALGREAGTFFGYTLSAEARRNIRPPVFGLEMFRVLRESKVALNNHIDVSAGSASNMRLFEVTGMGSCLLTDWKDNIRELFEPDTEVATYRSVEECVEKAKWLLENESAREEMARAGQARTLRDHSFANRARRLDEIIRGAL